MIIHLETNTRIATRTRVADTFWRRLKGLLGTDQLAEGEALMIRPCNSVHTFGMRYNIDVAFIGRDGHILKIVHCMRPGAIAICLRASQAIELPAGTLAAIGVRQGEKLVF